MDDEKIKGLVEIIRHELWHLVENTKHENGFDMLTWAFNLGQHQAELRKLKDILAGYIDQQPTGSYPEVTLERRQQYIIRKEDVEHIFHRLDFISTNMVP